MKYNNKSVEDALNELYSKKSPSIYSLQSDNYSNYTFSGTNNYHNITWNNESAPGLFDNVITGQGWNRTWMAI